MTAGSTAKPTTGSVLSGRYELTGPIGRGGMGEVYAGYDTRLDRPVAVKLLRAEALPHGADRETRVARFAREARLTAKVEHPGVPAVFDAGTDDDRLYLVMQLVPGTDLADFLAESVESAESAEAGLPVGTAAAIAGQVVSVLAAAHAVSLVHRDLKPRNVAIRPDGTVVVLDFGVAALLDADMTRLTGSGDVLGSPAYMSPEQVNGGNANTRSDLYSLGCILHELLAGSRPFRAAGSFAAMRQHVEQAPPALRGLRGDVPTDLEELVTDLLAKNPEHRPVDAAEVYERLRGHLPAPRPGHGGTDGTGTDGAAVDPTRPYRLPQAPPPGRARAAGRQRAVPVEPADVERIRDEAERLARTGGFTQAASKLAALLPEAGDMPVPGLRGIRLQLANTLLLGGDYAKALPHYQHLVDEVAPERATDDPEVLHWRVQIATCHEALGEVGTALAGLLPVVRIQRDRLGGTDPTVVELRRQVASLRASCGERDRATAELRELANDLGPEHPVGAQLAEVLHRLAHE